METIEIVVYMTIALIIGGMLIGFLTGWDFDRTYRGLKDLLNPSASQFDEVSPDQFIEIVKNHWKDCGYGETNKTRTVYVLKENIDILDLSYIFERLKKYNICESLQSASNACGTREDVVMSPINLPSAFVLECDPDNKQLKIYS